MEEEKHIDNVLYWEKPEIDLNLRHYAGHPSDVIKKIKSDIEIYLSTPNLKENHVAVRYDLENNPYMVSYNIRQVYSAIYNALNYYKNISYLPADEYKTGDTFLSSSIRTFNEDYKYLSERYDSSDLTQEPVISISSRIKSPLSFMDKVREKVTEYIEEGRDFSYFNESLRDLIGVRIVVNPPAEVQKEGLQAESDYLYKVYYDLMEHHGITRQNDESLEKGAFKFFPVNTRHDPNKLDKIKLRPANDGFASYVENGHHGYFRPSYRIPEIEQECVDSVTKDYNRFPKFKGYQSLHVCVIPDYSSDIEPIDIPKCIIPSACEDSFIEYQFRTAKQNEFAEHGPASHDLEYKPTGSYHRLAVPFYIEFDSPENLSEDVYDPTNPPPQKANSSKNKLKLRNFGESFKKFYGPSFEEFFGIPFKKFRDVFGSQDRNDILAKRKNVVYDNERDLYYAESSPGIKPNPISLALTPEEILTLRELLTSKDPQKLTEFFSKQHLQDAIIQVINTPDRSDYCHSNTTTSSGFTLYTMDISSDRSSPHRNSQEQEKNPKNDYSKNVDDKKIGSSLDDDL